MPRPIPTTISAISPNRQTASVNDDRDSVLQLQRPGLDSPRRGQRPTTVGHNPSTNTRCDGRRPDHGSSYWSNWTYDALGNRLTEVHHGLGGAADTTITSAAPQASQPDALTGTTTKLGSAVTLDEHLRVRRRRRHHDS